MSVSLDLIAFFTVYAIISKQHIAKLVFFPCAIRFLHLKSQMWFLKNKIKQLLFLLLHSRCIYRSLIILSHRLLISVRRLAQIVFYPTRVRNLNDEYDRQSVRRIVENVSNCPFYRETYMLSAWLNHMNRNYSNTS